MTKSGILGKGAVGLVAAVLAIGGASAVAMAATGSHNPGELAQSVAQIVEGCKDTVRTDDHDKNGTTDVDTHAASAARNNHGIGKCVSSAVNHKNGEAHQQANGVSDADERKSPSPSTSAGTHLDHGQGSGAGSVGAPGQGGTGNGSGDHGGAGDRSHHPTPSPHP